MIAKYLRRISKLVLPTAPGNVQELETPVCVLVAQSYLTFCNSMDYSLSGSSVHGILQARILEWAAIPSSRGSSRPRE